MRELPGQDVTEDLKIAMRVRRKSTLRLDPIFIEDAQGAEVREVRVVPVREGEGVVGVQPAVVGVAAGGGAVGCDFGVTERLGHFGDCIAHGLFFFIVCAGEVVLQCCDIAVRCRVGEDDDGKKGS